MDYEILGMLFPALVMIIVYLYRRLSIAKEELQKSEQGRVKETRKNLQLQIDVGSLRNQGSIMQGELDEARHTIKEAIDRIIQLENELSISKKSHAQVIANTDEFVARLRHRIDHAIADD